MHVIRHRVDATGYDRPAALHRGSVVFSYRAATSDGRSTIETAHIRCAIDLPELTESDILRAEFLKDALRSLAAYRQPVFQTRSPRQAFPQQSRFPPSDVPEDLHPQ